MTKSFDREPYLRHSNVAPDVTLSDYIVRKEKAMFPEDYDTNCAPVEPTQAPQAAPVALTETEVEFGLNNELEDPSDDEAAGFHRGVRWAEAQHGIGAAAQGGE